MKIRLLIAIGIAGLFSLTALSANADGWGRDVQRIEKSGPAKSRPMASQFCDIYDISGNVSGPGNTNGTYGSVEPGDVFIFTATGNGTGSWRIVGDPSGSITYASGGTFPGTLNYRVTAAAANVGVGFYVDSYTGDCDSIRGRCSDFAYVPVPATSVWSRGLMILLFGLAGLSILVVRRFQ